MQIFEGWKNHLAPAVYLKEKIQEVSDERLTICRACPFNSENAKAAGTYKSFRRDEHCTDCGCPLQSKTKCLSCHCPQNKWEAVTTPEEDQTMNRDETSV